MNPYVYKRKGSRIAKKSRGLQSLVTLIKEVTFAPVSLVVAFTALAFGTVSVIAIVLASQVEITNLTAQPEVRYGVKGEVKSLSLQQRSTVKEMVLGEAAYIKTLLTSSWNTSMKIYVQPIGYLSGSGKWVYEISWNRTKNAAGSLYVNGNSIEQTTAQSGTEKVEVLPGTKVKVEFYSQPSQKGTLLVRKFFIAKDKPTDESAVCPGIASCPAPAAGYHYEKTTNECGCGVMVKDGETDKTGATTTDVSFRYLKVDVKDSKSWVALMEVEVYGVDGKKITTPNTKVVASHDWANYPGKKDPYVGLPNAIVDGDYGTGWNAGETTIGCNWYSVSWADRAPCIGGLRSAWIQLDLGEKKDISKIKMLPINFPNPAFATYNLSVSDNGVEWKELAKIKTTEKTDHVWMVYEKNSGIVLQND